MRLRIFLSVALIASAARADYREFTAIGKDPALETRLRHAAEDSLKLMPKVKPGDLAITVVDLTNPALMARADYQGDVPFYPASTIKLFFMADIYMQKKETIGDVERAIKEMIVQSDNDAAAYLLDILADTAPGPPLEGRALRKYIDKRRTVNRDFARLGYDISSMMKPWSFGPFGRDLQVLGPNKENRNRLTANAAAALMLWIARGRAPHSAEMMKFLERPLSPPREDENQVKEFFGVALPAGAKLWSKAGWTNVVRHDVAYVELPNGRKLVIVIFVRGDTAEEAWVPIVSARLLEELNR